MQAALKGLIAALPTGYHLVVKLHPLSEIDLSKENVYTADAFSTFDMLFVSDYVISDYSCVVYEAGILGLPLCFYTFDLGEYTQNRGFALDYEKEMPGVMSGDPKVIMKAIEENRISIEEVTAFTDKYVEKSENVTEKIARFVLETGRITSER